MCIGNGPPDAQPPRGLRCHSLPPEWTGMESTHITNPTVLPTAAAMRLRAEHRQARAMWGPFHVLWADIDGRLHLEEPSDRLTAVVQLTPFALTMAEAEDIIRRLESDAAFIRCQEESERRSAAMVRAQRFGWGAVRPEAS
jgi:hypothetical protein